MTRSALAGAILLHVVLLAGLCLMSTGPLIETTPQAEISVDVDLLTQAQFDALTLPRSTEAPAPGQPVQSQSPDIVKPEEQAGMVTASRMMAATVLADPLSRQAREMLPRLAADERVEQLCGLEAMSQIHAWQSAFEPDRVTAYARAATKLSGRTLIADGAAFRSKRRWYDLQFRCEFSRDQAAVIAFAFRVGEPVPRRQWDRLGLPERY